MLSAGDWFYDPLWIPKPADAEVPSIKWHWTICTVDHLHPWIWKQEYKGSRVYVLLKTCVKVYLHVQTHVVQGTTEYVSKKSFNCYWVIIHFDFWVYYISTKNYSGSPPHFSNTKIYSIMNIIYPIKTWIIDHFGIEKSLEKSLLKGQKPDFWRSRWRCR